MAKYVKTEAGYQEIEATVSLIVDPAVANKMDKNNPVATGSFSMGRKAGSVIGAYSHAEGLSTTASGDSSHAEGNGTTASVQFSHAEGLSTTASGDSSHAEGSLTKALGDSSHAEGSGTTASGHGSHTEGVGTQASGYGSHAEGWYTTATNRCQHVQGEYNIIDTTGTSVSRGKYAHIVGNGTRENDRSNAHTLDWEGNAWFAGSVESTAIILKSTTSGSTKKFEITVDDAGTLSIKEV